MNCPAADEMIIVNTVIDIAIESNYYVYSPRQNPFKYNELPMPIEASQMDANDVLESIAKYKFIDDSACQ